VRTTNQNNRAAHDIGKLWEQLFAGQLLDKIPCPVSMDVYSIYTDYVLDNTDAYATFIGLRVSSL
jgi:predicted transcriptional regulator YdeE